MKKLLIIMLVLGMTQVGWAGILRVNAGDAKDHYLPSDIITIEVVAPSAVGMLGIDWVYGPGTASAPALHALLVVPIVNPGVLVNDGVLLVKSIAGSADVDIPAGEVLWQFEYHVPELPPSTMIEIYTSGVILVDLLFENAEYETNALQLHVIPEPMTIDLLGLGSLLLRRRK